ncbi:MULTISPECIES: hypothetical protein [unclassified Rhodococcus (in: high G+C Gram-positive bacteria)]|uniref:hypothetical protein n=1 Tax=unclassified Rhodococcus (in: high G+C Gram-positive bacteria) TaxID=192944 RepID=UPI0021C141FD|nr:MULTISPECIES: hypothetical protein [unclassified Rhodococcus (in: high G+C Gram-positive bacteria)]
MDDRVRPSDVAETDVAEPDVAEVGVTVTDATSARARMRSPERSVAVFTTPV